MCRLYLAFSVGNEREPEVPVIAHQPHSITEIIHDFQFVIEALSNYVAVVWIVSRLISQLQRRGIYVGMCSFLNSDNSSIDRRSLLFGQSCH